MKHMCLFNQPVACYFFNERLRHRYFLVNFAKLSRIPFLQTTLGLLLLYLLNIFVISSNLVLISQRGFSNHLRHHLKCIHVKLKLRERENLFSFFTSDSVNLLLLLSVVNSFMTEFPMIYKPVH